MVKSLPAKYISVRVTDTETLKRVGCPWSTRTLRQYHRDGKYPGLVYKVGGLLMLDVSELEKILGNSRKAPTGA